MMQTTEDSCPIICNVQISAICLSSSTYVTGLDSCQSDVAKAGVHKNVFAVLNVGLASGFEPVLLYISDAEIPRQIIVKSASDAEIPRPRKNRGSSYADLPRSYFDYRLNDTYVGFMKRHNDYHVTIPLPS